MSKILAAVMNGEATEVKALVKGEVENLVSYNNRYYVRSVAAARYLPVAKKDVQILNVIETNETIH